MSVIKIGKWDIGEESLSIKSVAERAMREAQKLSINDYVQSMGLEAAAIEAAKMNLDEIVDAGKEAIESKIKEETGYTIQEAKYKTVQAYEQAKGAIDTQKEKIAARKKRKEEKKRLQALKEGKEYEEPKNTSSKVRKKESIDDLVKKMPDKLYNAFFMSEILENIDKVKTVIAQSRDIGEKAVDEVLDQAKYIRDHFKKNSGISENTSEEESSMLSADNVYVKDSSVPVYMTSEETPADTGALNSALVSELVKTKASTRGEEVDKPEKKTTPSADKAIDMLEKAEPVLTLLKDLFSNWRKNQDSIRDDAGALDAALLKKNATEDGLQEIPAKDVFRSVDMLPGLRDDASIDEAEVTPQRDYSLEPSLHLSTDSSTAYVSDEPGTFSELDRIDIAISVALKSSVLDKSEEHKLISVSTREDGGKVKNLEYAGTSKVELSDAIEEINGGERL